MAEAYNNVLANLNQGQDLTSYALKYGVPVTYNPGVNQLLINNTPVDIGQSGLQVQNGKVVGNEAAYQQVLQPFLEGNRTILDAQSYKTPEYINQFITEMTQRQQQDFNYNFDDDPSVQYAKQELSKSISEMAGARGFLYGAEQQNIVDQQMQKLYPQFEANAYMKESDYLNRQMSMMGVIMQWDQSQANNQMSDTQLLQAKSDFILKLRAQDLQIFQTMLEQRRVDMEYTLTKAGFELEQKQANLEIAYKRLETLGYADKTTSLALGIPTGTRAQWAQKAIMEHENDLEIMKQKHKYNLEMQKINAKTEKELLAEQNRVSIASTLKLMQEQYGYDVSMLEQEWQYKKEYEEKLAKEAAEKAAAQAAEQAQLDKLEANLNIEYNLANKYLKANYVEEGMIPKANGIVAINYLYGLYKAGKISKPTFTRLKAEYGLPDYTPSLSENLADKPGGKNYGLNTSPTGELSVLNNDINKNALYTYNRNSSAYANAGDDRNWFQKAWDKLF